MNSDPPTRINRHVRVRRDLIPVRSLNDPELARIRRYLAGEESAADRSWIERWAAEDPNRRLLLERARASRERRSTQAAPQWDTEASWERLRARIEQGGNAACPRPGGPPAIPLRPARPRRRPALTPVRVAAMVLLALGIGVLWSQRGGQVVPERGAPLAEMRTGPGQQARFRLSDGTAVVLAAGSRLRYPPRFASGRRDVTLEGQAYFEVAADPARPFQVRAGESVTRVLGTKFSVQALPREGFVAVVVAEGRVAFGEATGRTGESVLLTAGHAARLADDGSLTLPAEVDVARSLGWLEGRLVFDDVPLNEVARSLERHYGVRIDVAESVATLPLTAEIRSRRPAEAVRMLSLSLGLGFTEHAGAFSIHLPSTGEVLFHSPGESTP